MVQTNINFRDQDWSLSGLPVGSSEEQSYGQTKTLSRELRIQVGVYTKALIGVQGRSDLGLVLGIGPE